MSDTVRQKSRGAAIAAAAMDRLFEPRLGRGVTPRPRFLAFVLLCLLLHLAILGFLLWEDQKSDFAPPPEENAVEVITEPPPPPPPPEEKKEEPPEEKKQEQQKAPPPPPPPPPEKEEPASDAPKLESKAKSEQDSPEEQEQAKTPRNEKPTEKVVPKDEKPEGLKDAQEEDGDDKAKPSPMKAIEDKPDAEIIERAEKSPKDAPDPKDTKAAKKGQGMTIADMVAAMAPLPDYKLAAPPKTSPVGGGQAKTTYLTILYGLIMPHMRIPPRVREIQMSSKGVVAFYIDEMGNLTHQAVYKSSGLPDLDAAALAAVGAAAPFPPPPRGLPHAMLFSYATK